MTFFIMTCITVMFSCYAFYSAHRAHDRFKKMLNKTKEQELQLLQSAKMASLGQMAVNIAHEIQTPLASINMDAAKIILSAQKGHIDGITSSAKEITKTVFQLANIVRALKTIAREGPTDQMETVTVDSIIHGALYLCKEKFTNHGVVINVSVPPQYRIFCYPTQMIQALLNLLNNSYDAVEGLQDKWVSINCIENQEHIEISITDSGRGIPLAIRDKIMTPFFTTKSVGKGTGLGLSISKALIENHAGIFFVDQHSKYTKFILRIPCCSETTSASDGCSLPSDECAIHCDS